MHTVLGIFVIFGLLAAFSAPFVYYSIIRKVIRRREWDKIQVDQIYKKWAWPLSNPYYKDSGFKYLRVLDKKDYHVKCSEWRSYESESEDAYINYRTMDEWMHDLKYIEDADL